MAQDDSQLTVGVYMKPNSYSGLDSIQVSKLETRIINIISTSGVTSNISASRIGPITVDPEEQNISMKTMARGVVCFPKMEVYGENTVDVGLKKINVVDVSLTLAIQYIHEDIIFSNLQLQLQGQGRNSNQAINNVIRNLRPNDSRFAKFLSQTREKIINYYKNNCDDIIEQARQLDRLDSPVRALQILWPIPREVSCYEDVKEMTVDIYRKYVNKRCRQLLMEARTYLAANNYDKGLERLRFIDPTSQCAEEAMKMIESIQQEIDSSDAENRKAAMALLMERQRERARTETGARIETEVARANAQLPILQQNFNTVPARQ
ncbi:hypothetical protein [Flavilitoribacter nigricans]|uniref:Uncharacterized protein n=1 Tax=Flavilitoribacter nigricans (strain ATCC 23147 / DSM 23189 / NBRC 102662 / NCIMB 1420 / SS-2) TaxID=1122177 RepID=A0A2D0N0J1_FLAN2|nr:hypothetical protein [Flavilitoribacter nigricans]PHN01233.1 hypothetical protein CRP01_38150 [Flavilitoribacter nigricans DSM 23189 = NBRC 102662]